MPIPPNLMTSVSPHFDAIIIFPFTETGSVVLSLINVKNHREKVAESTVVKIHDMWLCFREVHVRVRCSVLERSVVTT